MLPSISILTYILAGLVLLLIAWVVRLEMRVKKLLSGKNGESLEETIHETIRRQKELEGFRKEVETYLCSVEDRLKRSVQSIKTIRFNPFKGTGFGGNQSFSTAFLSENGDGTIISSLHARDRVSVFSKPIQNNKSGHELTNEEKDVLSQAKDEIKK